jgi:hypothetical protein
VPFMTVLLVVKWAVGVRLASQKHTH